MGQRGKMTTMVVKQLKVHVTTDKEGYVSLSTDGFKPDHPHWVRFMEYLRAGQDEDDLELQGMHNAPRTGRW